MGEKEKLRELRRMTTEIYAALHAARTDVNNTLISYSNRDLMDRAYDRACDLQVFLDEIEAKATKPKEVIHVHTGPGLPYSRAT